MVPYVETEQLLDVAKLAEELGFEGVMGSDHALFPRSLESRYPYSADGAPPITGDTIYPDPWVSTAAMAAVTTTLKFSTSVYILPLRNPIEVAKATGTLSLLSGGRFILGAGVGWMKEEFDACGVDFSTRGRRMDETIDVLHKLWGNDWVDHRGEFFHYDGIKLSPSPGQSVPIFTGGSSKPALRRAARVGQGWIGNGNHPDEVPSLLQQLQGYREEYGRDTLPFETVIGLTTPPDLDTFKRLRDQGMTAGVNYPFSLIFGRDSSLDEKRRVMEQFAESFIVKLA